MGNPSGLMVIAAVLCAVVTPQPTAFAQQNFDRPLRQDRPELLEPKRGQLGTTAQSPQALAPNKPQAALALQTFRGEIYHGKRRWEQGRWHHEAHNGRYGWWWDVGDTLYFYAEPAEGPPAHVSDLVAEGKASASQPTEPSTPSVAASHHYVYYRPGDFKGVPYDKIEQCWEARQRDGNIGVCMMK